MDKETLSNYGWIVICVMVLAVMLAFASPFGQFVADAVKSTTQGLFDTNQNALDSAGIEIMQQEFEEMLNGPSATDSPVKFGQPYQMTMEENGMSLTVEYVFYPDGSATMWMADAMGGYLPAGSVTYTETEVILEGDPIKISADGTYLYDPEDETFKMIAKYVSNGSPKTNTPYIADPNGLIGITGLDVQIGSDGSVTVYQNGVAGETIPASAITWYDNYFVIKEEGQEDLVCAIYPDGSKITIGEIVLVNSNNGGTNNGINEYGFYYNRPYYREDGIGGKVYAIIFSPNGIITMKTYENNKLEKVTSTDSINLNDTEFSYADMPIYESNITILGASNNGNTVTFIGTEYQLEGTFEWFEIPEDTGFGLYTADGIPVASWEKLVNEYGLDIEKDYRYTGQYRTEPEHIYCVLKNNPELSKGVKLVIPEGVTKIGESAFNLVFQIKEIVFPEGLVSIGENSFSHSGIQDVILPSTVTTIGKNAFSNATSIRNLYIPKATTNIGEHVLSSFEGKYYFDSITVEDGNPVYHSDGNCLIETATKTLIAGCNKSVIPTDGSVTKIAPSAFSSVHMSTLVIPNTVTEIGEGAFFRLSIKEITIPKSVTKIDGNVLEECIDLASITVENGNPVYHSDDNCLIETASKKMIAGCKNSVIPTDGSVTILGNGCMQVWYSLDGSFFIPRTIKEIEDYAFSNCVDLTSVVIEKGVEKMGIHVFYYTDLQDVYFTGTEEEWNQIQININTQNNLKDVTIHYNHIIE